MPFTTDDVEKHTKKAITDKLKRQWVKVANAWRDNCTERGGSEETCDASAIKAANGVIARQVEEAMSWGELRQIAMSAIEVGLALANDSGEITPERADKALRKWEVELGELQPSGDTAVVNIVQAEERLATARTPSYDGTETISWATVKKTFAAYRDGYYRHTGATRPDEVPNRVQDAPVAMKRWIAARTLLGDAGADLESDLISYPVVNPNTNKLNAGAVRNASARGAQAGLTTVVNKARSLLDKEFRQEESAADVLTEAGELITRARNLVVDEVMGSLRDTANRVEDAFHASFSPKDRWEGPYHTRDVFMAHPTLGDSVIVNDRENGQMFAVGYVDGDGSIEFSPRPTWQPVELTYVPVGQPMGEMESIGQAVETRDATEEDTANLSESEAAAIETGRRAPVIVDFQILQPGPGNSRDNRYYPADVVERDIHVFEGVDVFATDHQEKERSERTKVGQVLACPSFFTESRAPVASVLLYDPNQAEKARNRADADALATLECSILGNGRVKDGEIDGKKYKIVEAITNGRYLELVSKAGAGGRALNLAEVEPGGSDMTESQEVAPVEEVEIEEAGADVLDDKVVKEALGKTNLPEFVKTTLAERKYPSDSELQAAIDEAVAEVKKLTGSGQVTELGVTRAVEPELSLEEREERRKKAFNEIMAEVGLRPV